MAMETLIWLIPLPPLVAFFLIVLFTHRSRALSHWLALIGAGLAWLASMIIFFQVMGVEDLAEHPLSAVLNWLPTGNTALQIGVMVDPLTAVSLFFVAWTIFMIFIYSVAYHNYGQPAGDHDHPGLPPHGATVETGHGHSHKVMSVEPMYSRFFAFISLFAFGMFTLVVSDNLLTLFIGWEIMGLCSYLLIGFWYAKPSARDAAVKAFITTRIGDVVMLLGLAALYVVTGSLKYSDILSHTELLTQPTGILGMSWGGLIGLMLFVGTVGKSAQFPLHVWLPDAMEGPTPVSAMIHAATMVSAGIYLGLRFFPLASMGWQAGEPITTTMTVMAVIGAFTAIFAATIAAAQTDIKRVLAFSTISQLGYMVAALGIGAYVAAAFHLITHAFFKALLFLGSGSVIHGMEHGVLHTGEKIDPQDMNNMGGLRKKMPVTFWTFVTGGLALSGFPLITAGFWSKDEILSGAFNSGHLVVFITLALAALLTAFYTMRQITLTFLGQPRTRSAEHASENKWVMTLPLVILSFFAIAAGWVGIPKNFPLLGQISTDWFAEFVGQMVRVTGEGGHGSPEGHSYIPLITSLVVALGGLYLGWLVYRGVKAGAADPLQRPLGSLYRWMQNKYYFDELYQLIFIRPARWISETFSYQWIDRGLIDGFLHGVARFSWWLGERLRNWFDLPVVNGAGDTSADGVQGMSSWMKGMQSGRVQQYMVAAISVLVLLGVIILYIFRA